MKALQYKIYYGKPEKNLESIFAQISDTGLFVLPLNGLLGFSQDTWVFNEALVSNEILSQICSRLKKNQVLLYGEKIQEKVEGKLLTHEGIFPIPEDIFLTLNNEDIAPNKKNILYNTKPFHGENEEIYQKEIATIAKNKEAQILLMRPLGAINGTVYKGQCFKVENTGQVVARYKAFEPDTFFEPDTCFKSDTFSEKLAPCLSPEESIFKAITLSIQEQCAEAGINKVCLGLSGGMDSALVAPLAVSALGKTKVYGLLMPSCYSSDHSIQDAKILAENLGIDYEILPIENIFKTYQSLLNPFFEKHNFQEKQGDVTFQNIQSRIRGQIVMAYANKNYAMALGTGNKSEIAMGYCTLYGDTCAGLFPIGDLYKSQVYSFGRWYNKHIMPVIPEASFTKAPSAELAPNQKDSDSLPDYSLLDTYLMKILENKENPLYCEHSFTKQTRISLLQKIQNNEFKRMQCGPITKVSNATFGKDLIFPKNFF